MKSFPALVSVTAEAPARLHLSYDAGTSGHVDLDDVAGRGVFAALSDPSVFDSVSISPEGQVRWSEDIEICADALYMELTGLSLHTVATADDERHA
jgi:hypothetical protein